MDDLFFTGLKKKLIEVRVNTAETLLTVKRERERETGVPKDVGSLLYIPHNKRMVSYDHTDLAMCKSPMSEDSDLSTSKS